MTKNPITVRVEERLDLCGFAYFQEPRGSGRLLWVVDKVGEGAFRLALSPSWGLPSDAAVDAVKVAIKAYVEKPRAGPFATDLSTSQPAKSKTKSKGR